MKEGKGILLDVVKPRVNGVFIFMFTGIITETGTVVVRTQSGISISTNNRVLRRLKRGGSIAVDGACLTIVAKGKGSFSADILGETLQRTMLGSLSRGALVNLELPATLTSFLSGHIVQGHIDGVGKLISVVGKKNGRILKFSIPRALSKYVVQKGSIAVNGVALTVVNATMNHFTVHIIPHTWQSTSFQTKKIGARVNIEVDVLAKYVEKFV
ncbi:riboflavin synthase [Candidatus Kaiserbacteria bacterium]|nr:riboflavin synthase [Candidatus Kaiserbacteria bacterium]